MKKHRFHITIGILFILAGMLLGSDYLIRSVRAASSVANAVPQGAPVQVIEKEPTSAGLPTHVSIDSVDVSVDVKPGYYNPETQTWTLTDTEAHFVAFTDVPSKDAGNTYIYGHNTPAVFRPVNNAKVGDIATVTTSDGATYQYRLHEVRDLQPNDASWLLHEPTQSILTLQTCAGFWDEFRRLFIFYLVSEA